MALPDPWVRQGKLVSPSPSDEWNRGARVWMELTPAVLGAKRPGASGLPSCGVYGWEDREKWGRRGPAQLLPASLRAARVPPRGLEGLPVPMSLSSAA